MLAAFKAYLYVTTLVAITSVINTVVTNKLAWIYVAWTDNLMQSKSYQTPDADSWMAQSRYSALAFMGLTRLGKSHL